LLIAGNWKLNCNIDEAIELSSNISNILNDKNLISEVVLFPPALYIDKIKNIVTKSNISLGSQECSIHISGAYTGEISALRLSEIGCEYIIVGHSERRIGKHETNYEVHTKAKKVINKKMKPIICVGENAKEREAGNA
jgi:Triosephosphate isomerase